MEIQRMGGDLGGELAGLHYSNSRMKLLSLLCPSGLKA
jgi:hypothetical protein